MKPADQKLLKEIRADLEALAKKMGQASKQGYIVGFTVDAESGVVKNFTVKGPIDIDSVTN
jgi:hypothetical protein